MVQNMQVSTAYSVTILSSKSPTLCPLCNCISQINDKLSQRLAIVLHAMIVLHAGVKIRSLPTTVYFCIFSCIRLCPAHPNGVIYHTYRRCVREQLREYYLKERRTKWLLSDLAPWLIYVVVNLNSSCYMRDPVT